MALQLRWLMAQLEPGTLGYGDGASDVGILRHVACQLEALAQR
jgi:hypothetical protein